MFEEIIGQELPKKILSNAIKENRINHAYIFCGRKGTGRLTTAKKFSQYLICKNKNACMECSACKQFLAGTVDDFKIISASDGKSAILVEQIRELTDDVYIRPHIYDKKIYIINDADKMNQNAQNAFLKVFEEPPEYAVFILIVSQPSSILPTIRSRGVEIRFSDLSRENLKEAYRHSFSKELSDDIAAISDGSVKTAADITENSVFSETREKLLNLFPSFIRSKSELDMLNLYECISLNKDDSQMIMNIIYTVMTDIMNTGKPDLIKINDYGIKLSEKKIYGIFGTLEELSERMTSNASYGIIVLDALKKIRKILTL